MAEMKPFPRRITCYCGGLMTKDTPQICETCGWEYDPKVKGKNTMDDHKRHKEAMALVEASRN